MDSVRVSAFNDLRSLSEEALILYKRQRKDQMLLMAAECNRHEAKRALHQMIDAIEEQRRRGIPRSIR